MTKETTGEHYSGYGDEAWVMRGRKMALGRTLRSIRTGHDITIEDWASRAQMDPDYLLLLEQKPLKNKELPTAEQLNSWSEKWELDDWDQECLLHVAGYKDEIEFRVTPTETRLFAEAIREMVRSYKPPTFIDTVKDYFMAARIVWNLLTYRGPQK